jgi:hypothetical protein
MGQMSVQYTPVQVLQAARRAEAEGKMDYALQFYRHLVEHHSTAAEAQEAREGLFRIAEWRWGETRVPPRDAAPRDTATRDATPRDTATRDATPRDAASRDAASRDAAKGLASHSSYMAPSGQQQHAYAASEPSPHLPQIIAREAARVAGMSVAQPYKARYRSATIMAYLLSGVGWAVVSGGLMIALLAAAGVVADVSAGGALGLPIGVLLGIPAAVIGLVLIVIGQAAVAVFESTNATLDQVEQGGRGRADA